MTESAISAALAAWVSGVTDRVPVFDSQAQRGPRPSRPFCSMLVGSRPNGRHATTLEAIDGSPAIPNPNLRETSCTGLTLLISMNMVGGDSTLEDMDSLRASLGLSTWRESLWAAGLGFVRMSDVRDLTEIVKNAPEPRAQADWEFHAVREISDEIHSIEQVPFINAGRGSSFTVGA